MLYVRKSAPSQAPVAVPQWVRPSLASMQRNTRVLAHYEPSPALSREDWAIILIALVGTVIVWSFVPGLLALALLG